MARPRWFWGHAPDYLPGARYYGLEWGGFMIGWWHIAWPKLTGLTIEPASAERDDG